MMERLIAANRVLKEFAHETQLSKSPSGHVLVHWSWGRGVISRRWMCKNQDWYPVWQNKWPYGGTSTLALSQLVRWVQDKAVVPISSWIYWKKIGLFRHSNEECIKILLDNGYPEAVSCVLCGANLTSAIDWWSLGKVKGPCCPMNKDCKSIQRAAGPTNTVDG